METFKVQTILFTIGS